MSNNQWISLCAFLNVVGSGTILKIGFEHKNGFAFVGRTIHLYETKEIIALYGHNIVNVYIVEGEEGEEEAMAIILE